MTVHELITELQKFDKTLEVAILDGFNGGGQPRTINLGPQLEGDEAARRNGYDKTNRNYSDLETYRGNTIVVMGYGCY